LCAFLFDSGRFVANKAGFYQTGNADLLWMITQRKGNPIGLAVLAMLVAHRLNLTVGGCNFPAHFLAWITIDGKDHLVDCFGSGRIISVAEIRSNSAVLTPDARRAVKGPCSMRDILLRILGNLQRAYSEQSALADANLIGELVLSLEPAS
jgi:regulator of sirC expression with transglutaminase-like and TPR domain